MALPSLLHVSSATVPLDSMADTSHMCKCMPAIFMIDPRSTKSLILMAALWEALEAAWKQAFPGALEPDIWAVAVSVLDVREPTMPGLRTNCRRPWRRRVAQLLSAEPPLEAGERVRV